MRILMAVGVFMALVACDTTIPGVGAWTGFGLTQTQDERDANLSREAIPPAQVISEETLAALEATKPQTPLETTALAEPVTEDEPLLATPDNPAPTIVDNPTISDENDFSVVETRRDIEDDAERLAHNRKQYRVIEATAIPKREDSQRPNIVSYAVQTNNPVGVRLYRRLSIAATARYTRNCAKFISPDKAQEEFLSRGGPQLDRFGLDPDGDGFACEWDPSPFRIAVGN